MSLLPMLMKNKDFEIYVSVATGSIKAVKLLLTEENCCICSANGIQLFVILCPVVSKRPDPPEAKLNPPNHLRSEVELRERKGFGLFSKPNSLATFQHKSIC